MYTGKGGGVSKQKPASIPLVTSFFCLKGLQGRREGGQIFEYDLSVWTLWIAPYSDALKFFKD